MEEDKIIWASRTHTLGIAGPRARTMLKTTLTLTAAFVLGLASAAHAQSTYWNRTPNGTRGGYNTWGSGGFYSTQPTDNRGSSNTYGFDRNGNSHFCTTTPTDNYGGSTTTCN